MSTTIEAELEQLWQEVLGAPPSSPDANFFLDGGSSVAAMKLMGRVRRRWGKQVTLRDIFDHATLRSLADRIETVTRTEVSAGPAPVATGTAEPDRAEDSRADHSRADHSRADHSRAEHNKLEASGNGR